MKLWFSQIKIPASADEIIEDTQLLEGCKLQLSQLFPAHQQALQTATLEKKSLDARRGQLNWVMRVEVAFNSEVASELLGAARPVGSSIRIEQATQRKKLVLSAARPVAQEDRPLVVGSGPAGLFAALVLAEAGLKPILIERGEAVADRKVHATKLMKSGDLYPESNLAFGEGGAGTFSDGKLYTRKNHALVNWVYQRLVEFGAPESILYDARPHVGTDGLRTILAGLNRQLQDRGGEVLFKTKLVDLEMNDAGHICAAHLENSLVASCVADDEKTKTLIEKHHSELRSVATQRIVLATGHSARDTYRMLAQHDVAMEAKAYSMGCRVEHPQSHIDEIQFSVPHGVGLPPAEYWLTSNGPKRSAYSFCMCPGGVVVPVINQPHTVSVNGMSYSGRSSPRANAALVVTVTPEDIQKWFVKNPSDSQTNESAVLRGMLFQEHWEHQTYLMTGGSFKAPAVRVTDFLKNKTSATLPKSSYRPGIEPGDVTQCLPSFVTQYFKEQAFKDFEQKMPGYITDEAIMIGIESRTSAPVRILRDESGQSTNIKGLYPVGEGAGYAGGIVSAAIDGVKIALNILEEMGVAHHLE